jgi:hypothetical protein
MTSKLNVLTDQCRAAVPPQLADSLVDQFHSTTRARLADHARQVRDHVRTLASRDYWKALPVTPDFVVMFVPGEAFFAAAIESDPNLFEQAVRQRVLISTPTTLIALVKAIAHGWQQEKLAENAQAVASLARDLFDRIKVSAATDGFIHCHTSTLDPLFHIHIGEALSALRWIKPNKLVVGSRRGALTIKFAAAG